MFAANDQLTSCLRALQPYQVGVTVVEDMGKHRYPLVPQWSDLSEEGSQEESAEYDFDQILADIKEKEREFLASTSQ